MASLNQISQVLNLLGHVDLNFMYMSKWFLENGPGDGGPVITDVKVNLLSLKKIIHVHSRTPWGKPNISMEENANGRYS